MNLKYIFPFFAVVLSCLFFCKATATGPYIPAGQSLLLTIATSGTSAFASYGTTMLFRQNSETQSAQLELDYYVGTNLAVLEKDVSQGDGEYLNAFAEIVGCEKGPEFDEFKTLSKASHSLIFADRSNKNIVERWRQMALSDSRMSKCFRS